MEKTLETPPKVPLPVLKENNSQEQNTLSTPNQTNSNKANSPICISGKTGTPDRLKVPKAFKYIERYTSPTDQMMSPVTRGILARGRKGSNILPPSTNQTKVQVLQLQESGPISNRG